VPRLSNYGLGAGGGGYGGGMSDLLAVPYADAMLVPVPEGCAPADCVAAGCNLVDVHRCLAGPLGARAPEPGERLRRSGYAVVCDLSLDERQLAIGAAACAPDGYCMVPWIYPGNTTPLPLAAMFRNNVTLVTGQPHARSHVEPVLDLIARGAIRTTTVPTEVVDWSDADVAYGLGTTKRIFVR
jgi:threonine dehydrogenase-like Zn-dependent dehydrogenase